MKRQWWKRRPDRRRVEPQSKVSLSADPKDNADPAKVIGTDIDETPPQLVAVGTGGRIELMEDHILLIRNHFLGDFINIFGLGYGKIHKSIMIEDISSVAIIRPMIFPDFIVFTYPGSPQSTGNVMSDALNGNALIMNLLDNRKFYELKEQIHASRQTLAMTAGQAIPHGMHDSLT